MDGAIVIDKPEEWTSHDVVNKVRRTGKLKKVGHLGTLDPIATGVLPLVLGRATRLAQFYTRSDKVYECVVRFGFATDTYDRAGTPTGEDTHPRIDGDELERHLAAFRGTFLQAPPPVSAKKVDGVRAYKLARENPALELAPVPVEVFEAAVLDLEGRDARIRAHCSGGFYMRSLAHDLGRAMGCGAHLYSLRRTASGDFRVEQAITIEKFVQLAAEDELGQTLIPAAEMLPDYPSVLVDERVAALIRQGRNFPASPFRMAGGARHVKAVTREGQLIAIGAAVLPNLYHPVVVL